MKILICSNCHKELHSGIWNIEDLKIINKEEIEPNDSQ
jgi:predicted HNH restriction endonuclease